ncbi:MAG: SEC-C metal-binding domain-containing protein, partial [Acidimicrobiales bacterium]
SDEGRAELLARVARYEQETKAEGEKVCDLGGLYVLGTERHESRRIDNQLRGRAGRQGDPGESRFYLSLEDDLMRLFATGAINWVMGKALPDDVPLEAKMVSKAIERAQTTVEQKNGEIRKNVLKYDEVMNAQRKVIYALRDQILDQADLREKIVGEHLPEAVEALVETYCVADFHEEWDITGLHAEVLTYWPSSLSADQLAGLATTDDLYNLLVDDATTHYERREEELGAEVLRQVERQVMLRIIDTRWREHLFEMDYLQEGINLRAMGQRDPLTEWQREGYDMFGLMMKGIAQDLVRYVMHVQVQVDAPAPAVDDHDEPSRAAVPAASVVAVGGEEARVQNVQYSAPADPSGGGGMAAVARSADDGGGSPVASEAATMTPVVRSDWDKTPRNAPCPCGSGKKFKLCHGRV